MGIRLKRTGNYRAAALYGIIAVATLAFEVVIGVYVVSQAIDQIRNKSNSLAGLGILFGVMLFPFVIATPALSTIFAIGRIARERGMRAAAEHDSQGAPLATFQPEATLTLKGGETLELVRIRRGAIRQSIKASFTLVILALVFDLGIAVELPAINPFNRLDPFMSVTTPTPSLLDWVSLAYPLILCLSVCVMFIPATFLGRWQRIVADDQGVTLEIPGRKRRFVPWNDIVVFARPTDNKSSSPVGDYLLWGREHGLAFQIGTRKMRTTGTRTSQAQLDAYDYAGGYAAYEVNARRLLATISARSYMPLRTFAGNTAFLRGMTRRFPVQAIELEDVLATPEGSANLQPRSATIAAMSQPDASVTLRARVAMLPALVEALIWSIVLGAWCLGFIALTTAGDPYVRTPWQELQGLPQVAVASVIGCVVLLIVGVGAAFAFGRRATRNPPVAADAEGLHTRTQVSNRRSTPVVTLPWGSIRAWGVLPAVPGSRRPATYFAFTDDQKAIWKEPVGARLAGRGVRSDRRAAYRARAEELHALIAAKTGLPLKVLGTVGMPAGASGASAPISPLP